MQTRKQLNRLVTAEAANILRQAKAAETVRLEVLAELFDACGQIIENTGRIDRAAFEAMLPMLQRMTEALRHAKTIYADDLR